VKITHVLPALTKGGAERVAVDLATAGAAAGHSVTVIAGWEVDRRLLADRLTGKVEVKYIAARSSRPVRRYLDGLVWVVRNWAWLSQQDVIHCHLTFGAVVGTFIRLIRQSKNADRPAVVETYHAVGMPMPHVHRFISARLAAYRDGLALMAEDAYWKDFQEKHPGLLSRTILNGVSPPKPVSEDEKNRFRKAAGIPRSAHRIVGMIGALRPERRTQAFVPAFEEIARQLGPDVHFLIGGDGPARPHVERAIAASSVAGRVHMAGLVHEPAEALAQLDLYLTLNVGSTTGIAALEAAMAGVPVLALQLRDDYTQTEQDWIWSTLDATLLGARAAQLLADPDTLRELGLRQQAEARRRFSVEGMARAYEEFYAMALQRRGASSRSN
jgi:glycosyltransferase involved in cell wall biosynthesis